MSMLTEVVDHVIGVDPDRDRVTVALVDAATTGVIARGEFPASPGGYQAVLVWAGEFTVTERRVWSIEGAGSYGAGLAVTVSEAGEWVVGFDRPEGRASKDGAKSSSGEPVRNRDLWTVTARHDDGSIPVTHVGGHGDVTLPTDYVCEHVRLGYAATEHGTQSDTVTIGINLASAVTGRRGLYVGATRGRETNTIQVVTESDDLDEARDVLEAVLATDSADIPAVAQRQSLAELVTDRPHPGTVRRPVLRARCVIPASFAVFETLAHEQLTAAREAIRAADRRRHELDEHAAALARATAAFEPHRAALHAAASATNDAAVALRIAQRRLDESRVRGRRAARNELHCAEQALVAAMDDLNRVQPIARPLRDAYVDARTQHDTARRMMVATEITDRWSDHPARVDRFEQLLDGLETWKQWARGHDVPAERLSASAAIIRHEALHTSHQPLLAATVNAWATIAQLDLPPASPGSRLPGPARALGTGIEL